MSIALLLAENKILGGKESVCPFERLGEIPSMPGAEGFLLSQPRTSFLKATCLRRLLMVRLRSQLPLKDSPSLPPAPLLYRSEHWGALRHPSCSYIFSTFSKLPSLLSLLSEYPLKWWVYHSLLRSEDNHWQKHCFQSILFAYILVSIFGFVFCCWYNHFFFYQHRSVPFQIHQIGTPVTSFTWIYVHSYVYFIYI